MVDFTDIIIIIQFLVLVTIFFAKLYNVLTGGTLYDMPWAILTFIGGCLSFGIAFVFYLSSITSTTPSMAYTDLFLFEIFIYGLLFVLFIAEVFYHFKTITQAVGGAYKPTRN